MIDFILAIISVAVTSSLYAAAFIIFTLVLESINRK